MIVGFVLFLICCLFTGLYSVPLCLVQNIFQFPCPGCGMTSGFIAILHLDFKTAFETHILSVPIFVGAMVYTCLSVTDILLERDDIEKIEAFCKRKFMMVFFLVIFLFSLYTKYGMVW